MGYRSEVALVIKAQEYQKLVEGNPERIDNVKSIINDADIHKKDGAVFLYWDYIKWYDIPGGDPDVCAFMSNLNEIDEESWYMIIIGEDVNDIEINGSYYNNPFHLSLLRNISFNL